MEIDAASIVSSFTVTHFLVARYGEHFERRLADFNVCTQILIEFIFGLAIGGIAVSIFVGTFVIMEVIFLFLDKSFYSYIDSSVIQIIIFLTKAVHGLGALKKDKDDADVCEVCIERKSSIATHKSREKSTKKVLEEMQTDLCGHMNSEGLNVEKYVQLLTDDYSGAMWVSCMKSKSDAVTTTEDMLLHMQKWLTKRLLQFELMAKRR